MTCYRSVDFSGYSNFRQKSSNWHIFESGSCKFNYHTTTMVPVQLRWKVIALLILMEFMIITVYNWFAESRFFVGVNFRHKNSNWNIFESGVKHLTSNGQMMDQTFVYVVHNIKHLWVIMWELSVGLCPKNIYSFWIKLFFFILEVASIDRKCSNIPSA
jgi:hypothetical protein